MLAAHPRNQRDSMQRSQHLFGAAVGGGAAHQRDGCVSDPPARHLFGAAVGAVAAHPRNQRNGMQRSQHLFVAAHRCLIHLACRLFGAEETACHLFGGQRGGQSTMPRTLTSRKRWSSESFDQPLGRGRRWGTHTKVQRAPPFSRRWGHTRGGQEGKWRQGRRWQAHIADGRAHAGGWGRQRRGRRRGADRRRRCPRRSRRCSRAAQGPPSCGKEHRREGAGQL